MGSQLSAAAATASDEPIMAVAELPEGAGEGAEVTVRLLPAGRPSTDHISVDWVVPSTHVVVDADTVTVSLEPSEVPDDYIDHGGLVTFEVAYEDGRQGTLGSSIATVGAIVVDGRGHWMDGGAPLPPGLANPRSLRPKASRAQLREIEGRSRVSGPYAARNRAPGQMKVRTHSSQPANSGNAHSALYLTGSSARVTSSLAVTSDTVTDALPADHSNNFCEWKDSWTTVWATVGTSYPRKKAGSTSNLWYSASTKSTFGVAKNVGDGWFSTSDTRSQTDDWGVGFEPSGYDRSYRVQVRYRKRKCSSMTFTGWKHTYYWIPRYQTGGADDYVLSSKPDWRTYCAAIPVGKWWRGSERGNDYSLSYGVKFKSKIGVDLKTQRQYSSAGRLVYKNPTKKRGLCGNNHYPSKASKMRERSRSWIVNNGFA